MKGRITRTSILTALAVVLALSTAVAFAQAITVALTQVGGSGVTATASLTGSGNQTTITISAQGLTPGSTNLPEVHFGTCANTGGVAFNLANLVASANGTATSTATINASLASLEDGNHELHIHAANAEGNVLTCGDIPVAAAAPTATPSAGATATPSARATVTTTPTPSALPSTGEPSLPLIPGVLLGTAILFIAWQLRRRPA